MDGFWDLPKEEAIKAYGENVNHTLTEKLLYAILAQLDKANDELTRLGKKK
jgi:hypothetical protein